MRLQQHSGKWSTRKQPRPCTNSPARTVAEAGGQLVGELLESLGKMERGTTCTHLDLGVAILNQRGSIQLYSPAETPTSLSFNRRG